MVDQVIVHELVQGRQITSTNFWRSQANTTCEEATEFIHRLLNAEISDWECLVRRFVLELKGDSCVVQVARDFLGVNVGGMVNGFVDSGIRGRNCIVKQILTILRQRYGHIAFLTTFCRCKDQFVMGAK